MRTSNRVGAVRPSQLMYTYGVGAPMDLPNTAVIIAGLDEWDVTHSAPISEDRLLAALQVQLGPQLDRLLSPPWLEETTDIFGEWTKVGVPVLPFPRWMRCPRCGILSSSVGKDRALFNLELEAARPDRARFVHTTCNRAKSPTVLPARFVVACNDGHIDEFPWVQFTHFQLGGSCPGTPSLEIQDRGRGTRSTEVRVHCRTCNASNWVTQAFSNREATMPMCRGREAHLRRFAPGGCDLQVKPLLLGASNAWFALTASALSIPQTNDPLTELVASLLPQLEPVKEEDQLKSALQFNPALGELKDHAQADIWSALHSLRGNLAPTAGGDALDLRRPEWDVLIDPASAPMGTDFRIASEAVPPGMENCIESVVRADRLREVVALTGFTRIDAPDSGVEEDAEITHRAPLARESPTWVPAAEVRGEGIFIRLPEDRLQDWEDEAGTAERPMQLFEAHQNWRARRGLDTSGGWPGHRYTLLHSLSHLLINELAMECGYSAASIRERIYCAEGDQDEAMAGILLYTSAPDSEGTLGGLVSLASPDRLSTIIGTALQRAELCASDPLCAEHLPVAEEDSLHLAACHSCLFIPETSCERGNRYLDRAMVVPTLASRDLAFFQDCGQ